MSNDEISQKQKDFCNNYLIDLNGKQAAIRAGYSEKTAESQASRLLRNVKVQQYLQRKMKLRENRTEITQDMVLAELAAVGFSRLNDFAEWGGETLSLKSSNEIDKNKLAAVDQVQEKHSPEFGSQVSIKLHNKMKALELLGKHLGMFNYEPEPIGRDRESNSERVRRAISRIRERKASSERRESKATDTE